MDKVLAPRSFIYGIYRDDCSVIVGAHGLFCSEASNAIIRFEGISWRHLEGRGSTAFWMRVSCSRELANPLALCGEKLSGKSVPEYGWDFSLISLGLVWADRQYRQHKERRLPRSMMHPIEVSAAAYAISVTGSRIGTSPTICSSRRAISCLACAVFVSPPPLFRLIRQLL